MILITGLTRSGTSLLFYLFVLSKLHTGYEQNHPSSILRAKLTAVSSEDSYALRGCGEFFVDYKEHCRRGNFPEVIKHPFMYEHPQIKLNQLGLIADPVVMTVRDTQSIINSEMDSGMRHSKTFRNVVRGSDAWKRRQESAEVDKLVRVPAKQAALNEAYPNAIRVEFPRYVSDFDYLWDRVGCLFPDDDKEDLREKFSSVADPELVRF